MTPFADENEYRKVRAYATSDLSELDSILTGKLSWSDYMKARISGIRYVGDKAGAFNFGSALHSAVLTPGVSLSEYNLSAEESERLSLMYEQVSAAIDPRKGLVEVMVTGTDEETGLPLKGKIDQLMPDYALDLKTTSAKTRNEFIRTMEGYGYFRQAAFYLSLTRRRSFVWVFVQKSPPYSVGVFDLAYDDPRILQADRENKALLRRASREAKISESDSGKTGWLPSSWFRI